MNGLARALLAGAIGAGTTNLLHEAVRRCLPAAPRVDLLGMQALAKAARALEMRPPVGRRLYILTFTGDLLSNTGYFALAAAGPARPLTSALLLGVAAGAGAVALPGSLGLTSETTARTPITGVLTCALYTAGGLAAGLTLRALPPATR